MLSLPLLDIEVQCQMPGSRNRAARQRALQIIYRPCRLIYALKEKKKIFLSLFATNTRIFAPLSSKQYCTEVNDYSFFQTIRHQSTKIAPTPIPASLFPISPACIYDLFSIFTHSNCRWPQTIFDLFQLVCIFFFQ